MNEFKLRLPYGIKLKQLSGYQVDLTKGYRDTIYNYFENFNGFNIDGKEIEIIAVEKEFNLLIQLPNNQEIILNGFIDIIGKDDDGNFYIIDHKSKKQFNSEEELFEYMMQLYIYSIAVQYLYGKFPCKLIFNLMRTQKLIVENFSEQKLEKAIDWLNESVNKINNEQWFFPLNFSQELNCYKNAYGKWAEEANDIYSDAKKVKILKGKLNQAISQLQEKAFFCLNLCGHSKQCPALNEILQNIHKQGGE